MAHCTKDAIALFLISFYLNRLYSMQCGNYSSITGNNNTFVSAITDMH